jgi:glutathione S-transferase
MNQATTFELTLTRLIRAPRQRVFDAFVKPELMAQWMCPRGMKLTVSELDPRPGGRYSVTMRAKDGDQFTAAGSFKEVSRPEKLVYTWQWQGEAMPNVETLITVTLAERDGATELRMTHSGFPDAGMRDSHTGGWNSCMNRLVDALDPRGSAATVTLLGSPLSSYVRTARMGLAEKGVKYTLEPHGPNTAEMLAVHPFGKVPAFRDGDLEMFETSAILRYVDESFDGPALIPGNIRDRARCEQWVSAVNAYMYDTMVRRYVLQYIFKKDDRSVIEGALKEIPGQLAILDRAYDGKNLLAGANVSIADLFLAPILYYVEQMPEGKALLAKAPNVRRAQAAMRERESFKATEPPRM